MPLDICKRHYRGLHSFRKRFRGVVWLEVMLVSGVNDAEPELRELHRAIKSIKPERVQLNTVIRPPTEEYARPLTRERLDEIADFLGGEVIADFKRKDVSAYEGDKEELIRNLLKRRQCTLRDISSALGLHENEVVKYVLRSWRGKGVLSAQKDI